ncbi:hypothetical protein [Natrinema pallidum]|uniref:hypothetical protein n=1 Tax=Natrinema pallidum TaxID=69527 RepID=UPI001375FA74|nr:hypothetical protein [Natrinema pallidum]
MEVVRRCEDEPPDDDRHEAEEFEEGTEDEVAGDEKVRTDAKREREEQSERRRSIGPIHNRPFNG